MIDLDLLREHLRAEPFQPFTLTMSSGDRVTVKTADHADIPPLDEAGNPPEYFIVYNDNAVPRYVFLDKVNLLEAKPAR
jgi:hypothetical protein